MSRMPIRNHRKLSLWKHANPQQYGGLVEVSLRYTPVTGRLHTRYAPVRRSSAEYCYSLLPLDLHVLSLPLAFILSQDQTLHCKNCSFTFLDSSSCPRRICIRRLTHAISSSHPFQSSFVSATSFGRKRVQRYNLFQNRPNIFLPFFENYFESIVNQRFVSEKNFCFPQFFPLFHLLNVPKQGQKIQKLTP